MVPVDCRGLGGWERLDLFSHAVSMSNRSLSLARPCDCCIEGGSWELGSPVTFSNKNSKSIICDSIGACIRKQQTRLV